MQKSIVGGTALTQFDAVYAQAAADVLGYVDRRGQLHMARHDPSLHPDRFDLGQYLGRSTIRYQRALAAYQRSPAAASVAPRMLDVGGFLAAFPLAMSRLGFQVTVAERFDYYHGAFDRLRNYLVASGVAVWDADLTDSDLDLDKRSFDLVTNMAMVEHLPNSPKPLMDNLRGVVAADGRLLLEVPNIAYWPKRLQVLRGRSLHAPLRTVYDSEEPYLGHHREYTRAEVVALLEWSGFSIEAVETYTYSLEDDARGLMHSLLRTSWHVLDRFGSLREVILACAAPV